MFLDFRLQQFALTASNYLCANLSAALQQSHDHSLILATIPNAAGADKLKLSVSAVEQILLQYPGLAGKQPTDAAKYTATVTEHYQLLADFLNLFPGKLRARNS